MLWKTGVDSAGRTDEEGQSFHSPHTRSVAPPSVTDCGERRELRKNFRESGRSRAGILRARLGVGNERKFQRRSFAGTAVPGDNFHRIGQGPLNTEEFSAD